MIGQLRGSSHSGGANLDSETYEVLQGLSTERPDLLPMLKVGGIDEVQTSDLEGEPVAATPPASEPASSSERK